MTLSQGSGAAGKKPLSKKISSARQKYSKSKLTFCRAKAS
ncbi:Uncharacterised protein [Vibrio cholerae]|nr:Uncharacterised protein [Vibrio cholerae]CSH98084.1 Uncharacterised protein [Vibrio cholerae]CSI28869.1 Uncharacterised protein [Vibrio cholerae]